MSMTEDEARYEAWMDELYAEHSKQAIQEFTAERLRSFYLQNPLLATAPLNSLAESRALLAAHPTAALVFAVSAIEVGLTNVLLKPIVYGLIHSESAAGLITELTLGHKGLDRFRELLLQILLEHGGIDLNSFKRQGSTRTLWEEIGKVQKWRNTILHRAESASNDEAMQAIEVASAILETLFPAVVTKLGFHLHDGMRICDEWRCKYHELLSLIDRQKT